MGYATVLKLAHERNQLILCDLRRVILAYWPSIRHTGPVLEGGGRRARGHTDSGQPRDVQQGAGDTWKRT